MDGNDAIDVVRHWPLVVPAALALFSTVHTYLGKHPRAQALAKLVAHAAGPLNLPAVWRGVVELARAIVAVEDAIEHPAVPAPATDAPVWAEVREELATVTATVVSEPAAPPPLPSNPPSTLAALPEPAAAPASAAAPGTVPGTVPHW